MSPVQPTSTLVRGAACLWTGERGDTARRGAAQGTDIRYNDGRVVDLGHLTPLPGEAVIDASGCVVMPGWVNTHHHLFQSLLKGVPAGLDLGLMGWLSAVPVRYRRGFDHEAVFRTAMRVGLVELLLSGCTTVADHQYHNYPDMPFDTSAVVFDEADRLGMRMVLARGGQTIARAIDTNPSPQNAPESLDAFLAAIERDAQRFHDPSPMAMRRVACAPSTPTWSVPVEHLKVMARHARGLGLHLHSHLSETRDYVDYCQAVHGCTPMQFAERHEWVGPDVWFAHMVHLPPADIDLVVATGTGIAHCPQSNGRLGSGVAPVSELLRRGARVSLAVDGAASNEAADSLSEAHAAWLLQRAVHGPAALSVADVVAMGTSGGAQVLGLGGVGTLAPGMAADLVAYELDDPAHLGLHDVGVAPVASGRARTRFVTVLGRQVVQNRCVPGLDMAGLQAQAQQCVEQLKSMT